MSPPDLPKLCVVLCPTESKNLERTLTTILPTQLMLWHYVVVPMKLLVAKLDMRARTFNFSRVISFN